MIATTHDNATVLFICEHGSAKSVVAAAHFNRMAAERQLPYHAISRGTDPDEEILPAAAAGLSRDGLEAQNSPRMLSGNEILMAAKVITFIDLPAEFSSLRAVEDWRVSAVSENYEVARDEIRERVTAMLDSLAGR
jgi:arsenate reductase